MTRPPSFLFFRAAQRALGRAALVRLTGRLAWLSLRAPGAGSAVRRNLRRIFTHQGRALPPSLEDSLLRRLAELYAETLVEGFAIGPEIGERAAAVEVALFGVLEGLRQRGRGCLLAVPHFGSIPLGTTALTRAGVPVNHLIVSARDYRWIEELVPGLRFLELGDAALPCLRALAANETVLLNSDMDYSAGGLTGELFGAPVRPPHGLARLALASGAPILPAYCVWEDPVWRLVGGKPITPEPGQAAADIERAVLADMERMIARHPEQWFFFSDPWDLRAMDAATRGRLRALARLKELRSLWQRS